MGSWESETLMEGVTAVGASCGSSLALGQGGRSLCGCNPALVRKLLDEKNRMWRLFLQGLDTSQACPWLAWGHRAATPSCSTLNSSHALSQDGFFPQTVP